MSVPATYRSGTPRNQHPAVARWHAHLRGLATAIHEISGLGSLKIRHLKYIQFHLGSRKLSMVQQQGRIHQKKKKLANECGQDVGEVKYGDLGWVSFLLLTGISVKIPSILLVLLLEFALAPGLTPP